MRWTPRPPPRSVVPNQYRRLLGLAAAAAAIACADVDARRYGVESVELRSTQAIAKAALERCLVTRERDRVTLVVGVGDPKCNEPPFDSSSPRLELWSWPWASWPTFNRAALNRDLERVVRFYQARGYHDARVTRVTVEPAALDDPHRPDLCPEGSEASDCRARITIEVDEGQPTRVAQVRLSGDDDLSGELRARLRATLEGSEERLVDEVAHDRTKARLRAILLAAGYAGAKVEGRIRIDSSRRLAQLDYALRPGPRYALGALTVTGHGALPKAPIAAAAAVDTGALLTPQSLKEVEQEVYALGAFSAVEVETALDAERQRGDIQVQVTPKRRHRLRLGGGVQSGALRRNDTGELQSVPQWDLHGFGRYEQRHVLGGLGRFRMEEQPRLIFAPEFPKAERVRFGNLLRLAYEVPGWLEPRLNTRLQADWHYGPDPFQGFFRSDIALRLQLRRGLLRRQLLATAALQQDIYRVQSGASTFGGDPVPASYRFNFLEQDLRLDLRDSAARPTRGLYAGLHAKEALRSALSDWTALSLAPEIRGYLPLPFGLVLASRFAIAANFVGNAARGLDDASRRLGPIAYRLRGGGANSNRGFVAGRLGAGPTGGLRRWEWSAELRVPLGEYLAVAGFADAGDVSEQAHYRFRNTNTAFGWGLRFYTPVGAIRLDAGYRIAALQRLGSDSGFEPDAARLPFSNAVGAWHLTLGDSF